MMASAVLEDLNKTSACFELAKKTLFKLQLTKVVFDKSALINRLL
jgi:hypothetical protein